MRHPVYSFAGVDTRFLGDVYQDLSEHAKKTYPLLQTPEFVEEFNLDHTMEPALTDRPLEGFTVIDPSFMRSFGVSRDSNASKSTQASESWNVPFQLIVDHDLSQGVRC